MNEPDSSPRRRRWWLVAIVYLALVAALVGGRGLVLASITGGSYRLASFVVESLSLTGLLVVLRIFEFGLRLTLRAVIRPRRRWQRVLGRIAYVILLLVIATPLILATIQLHPQRISCRGTPADRGLDFETVELESDGKQLSAWFVPGASDDVPIVLVAHGLNANKENFLLPAVLLRTYGFAVFLFDFRGHGDSSGWTVTFGALERHDVEAAYDWLRGRFPTRPIHALGYSMGGAAVIGAAAEKGIFTRIALDSTFASAENVARASILRPFGPLRRPMWKMGCFWAWLLSGVDLDAHRPIDELPALADRPLLLIHGTADAMIPSAETESLHRTALEAGGDAELWLVTGAAHVATMADDRYGERLARFFTAQPADSGQAGGD